LDEESIEKLYDAFSISFMSSDCDDVDLAVKPKTLDQSTR